MKAYTKLTVVMCCQSVAPSSGNFRWRPAPLYVCGQDKKIRIFFRKKIMTLQPRPRTNGRRGGGWYLTEFSISIGFLFGGLGGVSTIENLTLIFFFIFQIYFFIEASWRLEVNRKKVASSPQVLLEFSTNTKLILKVC